MGKKKTEAEEIREYLLKVGARKITPEERKTDWYKKEMETLDCPFTDEEFKKLCK